jgi:hypothetical protein
VAEDARLPKSTPMLVSAAGPKSWQLGFGLAEPGTCAVGLHVGKAEARLNQGPDAQGKKAVRLMPANGVIYVILTNLV